MEGYVSPIQRKSFPLSSFDMQGSFSNIPYAFFFENTARDDKFMPLDLLRSSFRASLQQFPILTGHLRYKSSGRINVEVDASNLNFPEYLESTCDSTSFDEIKASNFSWEKWPEGVVGDVCPVAKPAADGEIKLLNVHVCRLKDNSGLVLFVNIPHYVVDGVGFFCFVNHWAATMKSMAAGGGLERAGTGAEADYCFDREVIHRYLDESQEEAKPLDEISQSIYTRRNLFVDWLAWLSPTTLGSLLAKTAGLARGEAHLFHVSRATLDSLREEIRPHVPDGFRVSDNDLLIALLSQTYTQSQPLPEPQRGWSFFGKRAPETHFTSRIICDMRPRIGVKEIYTGNLLIGMFSRNRLENLTLPTTAKTLAAAAVGVRKTINTVDLPLVKAYSNAISQNPTSHVRPLPWVATHTTTSLVVSSHVRFKMYEANFGYGRPQFASLTPLFAGSYTMAAFLPPPPPQDGVNVLLTSNPVAMKGILENDFWRRVFKLVW